MMESKTVDLDSPLVGYFVAQTLRRVYLPAVLSLEPRNGNVGRLLLELQDAYDEVIVPAVVSPVLAGMLDRRGYHEEIHYAPEMEENVKCYVWRRTPPEPTTVERSPGDPDRRD